MNKFAFKFATAASTAVIALGSFGPAAFGTDITVTGNGSDSSNSVDLNTRNTTVVTQSNTATVTNNVSSSASTGGNSANRNTGGSTTIDTGNASNTTSVTNNVNSNVANVANCNCGQDVNVTISGNGDGSRNDVDVDQNKGRVQTANTYVTQTNSATVTNNVNSSAKTGGNDANRNTGGDVSIFTGDATTDTTIANNVNSNWASVGGSNGNGGGGVDVEITGNGSDSHNKVELDLNNTTGVNQSNDANVTNDVYASAKTGWNEANRNTGGDTSIDTGNADVTGSITNHVNFNAADLSSCDCDLELNVKIGGNGDESHNKVEFDSNVLSGLTQGNDATVNNDTGKSGADTGKNEANRNTGTPEGDPSVTTGDASSNFTVDNSVNSNVSGDVQLPEWSDMMGDHSNFSFDGFVVWMMAHMS